MFGKLTNNFFENKEECDFNLKIISKEKDQNLRISKKKITKKGHSQENLRTNKKPEQKSITENQNQIESKNKSSFQAKTKDPRSKASLKGRIKTKLMGSQFRVLNEMLYTNESQISFQYMKDNPEAFELYHKGYQLQQEKWPISPLKLIIQNIERDSWVICDLGCGDGQLYEYFANKKKIIFPFCYSKQNKQKKIVNNQAQIKKIFSFDLISHKDFIIAADIAHLKIKNVCADTCIFCLSLMGSNYIDYLLEAHRVLKLNGRIIIAEVKSRFNNFKYFIQLMKILSFQLKKQQSPNDVFILSDFEKIGEISYQAKDLYQLYESITQKKFQTKIKQIDLKDVANLILMPCMYKKR